MLAVTRGGVALAVGLGAGVAVAVLLADRMVEAVVDTNAVGEAVA